MTSIAVDGDTGYGLCLEHTTPTPSTTTFEDSETLALRTYIGSKPIVVNNTVGNATCGHTTTATIVSTTEIGRVFVESKGVHCDRLDMGTGDFPAGTYTVNPVSNQNVTIDSIQD